MIPPSSRTAAGFLVVWLAWLVYSLFAMQNVLAGALPGAVLLFGYYAWRLLVAIESAADGIHRLADAQED